jgi:hypothetical protein
MAREGMSFQMMAAGFFILAIAAIAVFIAFFRDAAKPYFSWVPLINWDGTSTHTIEMATFDSTDSDFKSIVTKPTGGAGVDIPGTTNTGCIIRSVQLVSLDDEEVEMDGLSIPQDGDTLEIKADDDSGDAGKGGPVSQATIKDHLKIQAEILVPRMIGSDATMDTTTYVDGVVMGTSDANALGLFDNQGIEIATGTYYKIVVSKDVDSLAEENSVYSWDINLSKVDDSNTSGAFLYDTMTLQFKFSFGDL